MGEFFSNLYYNIDFDIAAICVNVILLYYTVAKYGDVSHANSVYKRLVAAAILLDLFDIAGAVVISPALGVGRTWIYLTNCLFYIFSPILVWLFYEYLKAYVYQRDVKGKDTVISAAVIAANAAILLMLVLNEKIIVVQSDGTVAYTGLHPVYYIAPVYFAALAISVLIRNRSCFRKDAVAPMGVTLSICIVIMILQAILFPKVLIDGFIVSVCLLVLHFYLETPDYVRLQETASELEKLKDDLQGEVKRQTAKADEGQDRLELLTLQTMKTLASAIDARDPNVNGHSFRVADISKRLAAALGMGEKEARDVYYVGLLHDIGKIAVPDDILYNTGRLSEEDYELVKTHATAGAEILKDITTIPELAAGARWHHERYDGKGYPDGLKGDEIPFIARIVCVADSYDAMVAQRRYGRRFTQKEARDELMRGRGTQFDPLIVDKMVDLIEKDKFFKLNGDMYAD